ncbi:MAG: 16S rRNA processing protein RimM [Acidimicrobiia bacterium]|nr:16S rRNA processing protein RimM [Acidimicrobiia bacterium]
MTGPGPLPQLEVGRVSKAHGVRGEVVVELLTERLERVAPGARLSAEGRDLVVITSRPTGSPQAARRGGRGPVFLVSFEGVEDRTAAEALRGARLSAEALPADEEDDEGPWVHELIGSVVVELDGAERGRVVSIEANPAADLLVLESGALVPLNFVEAVADGRITVDTPAGLFD